jgi:hypothetical protein
MDGKSQCGVLAGFDGGGSFPSVRIEMVQNLADDVGLCEAGGSTDMQYAERPPLGGPSTVGETRAPIPASGSAGLFLIASIRSRNADFPHWSNEVSVYLRPRGDGYDVEGIDRESPEPSVVPMN